VIVGVECPDQQLALAQPRHLRLGRALHLQHDVGSPDRRLVADGRTSGSEGIVADGGTRTSAGLNDDLQAHGGIALDRIRRRRRTPLRLLQLLGNADLHDHYLPFGNSQRYPPRT
jgi:hypothetical protein